MSSPPGTYGYLFWEVVGRLYGESPPVWEVDDGDSVPLRLRPDLHAVSE